MNAQNQYSILTVDDDKVVTFIHRNLVKSLGNNKIVHHDVANGFEALKYIRVNGLPDLILLDLEMPVLNGFQFMEEFNKMSLPDKDKTYIVVVSSSSYPEDKNRSLALGVDAYLSKPIAIENLKSIMAPVLSR